MAHTCANAVNGKDKVHNVLSSRVLMTGRLCVIKTKKKSDHIHNQTDGLRHSRSIFHCPVLDEI